MGVHEYCFIPPFPAPHGGTLAVAPNRYADFAGRRIQIWDAFYAAYVEVTNDKHFDRRLTSS